MLLRLLVPAGFMIGAGAAGAPALILCDGYAQARSAAPMPPAHAMHAAHAAHQAPGHDPLHHREAPCPYAAVAAPVLPPLPPAVTPPAPAPIAVPVPVLLARTVAGAAASLPPATGPPFPA